MRKNSHFEELLGSRSHLKSSEQKLKVARFVLKRFVPKYMVLRGNQRHEDMTRAKASQGEMYNEEKFTLRSTFELPFPHKKLRAK